MRGKKKKTSSLSDALFRELHFSFSPKSPHPLTHLYLYFFFWIVFVQFHLLCSRFLRHPSIFKNVLNTETKLLFTNVQQPGRKKE